MLRIARDFVVGSLPIRKINYFCEKNELMQRCCSESAIDIGRIIKERTGKNIPRFLVQWMERFIHQDYINGFLTQGYEGAEFCRKCLEYLDVKIDVRGIENLDAIISADPVHRAKLTFASNHPLGGVDSIALLGVISERTGKPSRLLVNDFLMNIKPIASLSVPVNKMGGQSRGLPAQVRAIYESDDDILIFPAGKCSRKIDGLVQDPAWSKSFVSQSIATGRWIVPVRFFGENSKRFYRVESIRERLGIKFNIGMMLLPDELYRARHKRFRIVFGKPFFPTDSDETLSPLQWAERIRNEVYHLNWDNDNIKNT